MKITIIGTKNVAEGRLKFITDLHRVTECLYAGENN